MKHKTKRKRSTKLKKTGRKAGKTAASTRKRGTKRGKATAAAATSAQELHVQHELLHAQASQIPLNIKISENLAWMEKPLRRAKRHMPSLILPRKIRSYLPALSKEMRVYGTCAVETRVITLSTHRIIVSKRGKRTHKKITRRELLMTLAHEISHFRYGAHNYEQEAYARTIFQAFGLKEACPHCSGSGHVTARYIN